MPPTTEENLGRRRFLLHRDRAVEQALERVRRSPAAEWETLTHEERTALKNALTEIWHCCGRDRWEQYCFATLSKTDILALITLASGSKGRHDILAKKAKIETILLSCNRDSRQQ
jgi:hypothetical protein